MVNIGIAAALSRVRPARSPRRSFADRLLSVDPGLLRFHTALRSALASVLTGCVAITWAVRSGHPLTLPAFALLFAMIAPLFLRDAQRGAWFASLASLYISGCASLTVASVLAHWPLAGDLGFLAVLFAGVLCQACGPRALGSAMIGVVMFYLGLYLHPAYGALAWMIGLSAIALAAVVCAGRLVVPVRPAATLRRALRTVAVRSIAVLADNRREGRQWMADLSRLNEATLAVEEQLSLLDLADADTLRAALADVEVAAAHYAFDPARSRRTRRDLRRAVHRLGRSAPHGAATAQPAAPVTLRHLGRRLLALRSTLAWLPAMRATTAASIAMMIGQSLSPERWFWAVLTTFVVFLGTRSRGDTMRKVAERVLGTVAGVAVSAGLVAALHGMPVLIVAAMILCVFGWAFYILAAYGPGVFFITVLVGLVYGELGFAIVPLIELRVEEVLIGCLVSVAVAAWLVPLHTSHHVDERAAGVLDGIREVLRACAMPRDPAAPQPMAAMRLLDRRWHELRIALRPLQTQRVFAWNARVELAAGPLFACVLLARELARATRDAAGGTERIAARLDQALALVAERSSRDAQPARDSLLRELLARPGHLMS